MYTVEYLNLLGENIQKYMYILTSLNNTSKTNMYETQVFHLLTYPPTSCAILSLILSINSVSDTPCRLGLPPGLPIEKKPFKKRVFKKHLTTSRIIKSTSILHLNKILT